MHALPEGWRTVLTCLVGVLTLVGIMTRPFRLNEATVALAGAAILLLFGLIRPADALLTLARDWNTFFFFLGMMALSGLVEVAGLFDWLAVQSARLAGRSAARLFLNVFILGTLISMFLSNDATALILTPIVYLFVSKLRLPVLPFLFACTFIADTASFLLPISNPINVIILARFPLDLLTFLRLLFLPSLVVIAINIGVFFLLYRGQLKGSFDPRLLPTAGATVRHRAYFNYTCVVLALVAAGYVTAAATRFPLSLVAMGGATVLLTGALYWRQITLRKLSTSLVVHFCVHRGHVCCGSCNRRHRPDDTFWPLVDVSFERHNFGRGAGGRRGLCPGDESSQQRAHGGHHDRGPGEC